MNKDLVLSPLGHTWILDLDGTIIKHNGYKDDKKDSLLPGSKEFMLKIPDEDMIIFITSRKKEYKKETENFLEANGIRYNAIIYDAPFGERIIINDKKPSGLETAFAVNVDRDNGIGVGFVIDGTK